MFGERMKAAKYLPHKVIVKLVMKSLIGYRPG
jgi:hypothetical protein